MLIRDYIYCIAFLLFLFAIILLIYSKKNKNKEMCKNIILVSIVYIVYLVLNLYMIADLYIPVGLELLLICLTELVAGILYIISIISNSIKRKKLKTKVKSNKTLIITIILIILPALFLFINVKQDKYLINNSNLIVVYESDGNGGIGDGDIFAYSILDSHCKQFDLGIELGGYYLVKFLPKDAVEITNIDTLTNITDYKIVFNEDNSTLVYKGNKQICKINNKHRYFNIHFERGFYIN